jgi:hypothetical protein
MEAVCQGLGVLTMLLLFPFWLCVFFPPSAGHSLSLIDALRSEAEFLLHDSRLNKESGRRENLAARFHIYYMYRRVCFPFLKRRGLRGNLPLGGLSAHQPSLSFIFVFGFQRILSYILIIIHNSNFVKSF